MTICFTYTGTPPQSKRAKSLSTIDSQDLCICWYTWLYLSFPSQYFLCITSACMTEMTPPSRIKRTRLVAREKRGKYAFIMHSETIPSYHTPHTAYAYSYSWISIHSLKFCRHILYLFFLFQVFPTPCFWHYLSALLYFVSKLYYTKLYDILSRFLSPIVLDPPPPLPSFPGSLALLLPLYLSTLSMNSSLTPPIPSPPFIPA